MCAGNAVRALSIPRLPVGDLGSPRRRSSSKHSPRRLSKTATVAALDSARSGSREPQRSSSRSGSSRRRVGSGRPPPGRSQYQILGRPGNWQRASVNGRVRHPKLASDEAKLKELLVYCRNGNFREVRAIVTHYPYLLSLTDAHGFSPLHCAEMSGDPTFVSQLLQLYRDPRTFVLKHLNYETEEELLRDVALGVQVRCAVGPRMGMDLGPATVRRVGEGSLAEVAGLMPGDIVEAVSGASLLSHRQPPPSAEDVMDALREGQSGSFGFPVTLEVRGSACTEILVRDGWTPCHGAAGMAAGGQYRNILEQLLAEQERASAAQDAIGCTPQHWLQLERRATQEKGQLRRPLSAGPRGAALARSMQQGTLALLPPRPTALSSPMGSDASCADLRVEGGEQPQAPAMTPAFSRPCTPLTTA